MPLSGGAEGEGGGLSSLETKVSSRQNQNKIGGGRGVVLKKGSSVKANKENQSGRWKWA